MDYKKEMEMDEMHEERTTLAYNAKDAIRELENDLAFNKLYPNRDERTDRISIHTSGGPSLCIGKTACINWIKDHFRTSHRTQPSHHWAKAGELYVQLSRSRYRVWVSCYEKRFRTEASQDAMNAADETRKNAFAILEGEEQ